MIDGTGCARQKTVSQKRKVNVIKTFIIKLNEGQFTNVPWQKSAPFFGHNIARRSDVTDKRGQDKYESARRVSAGHSFLWRYQYFFSSSRLALPSGERTGAAGVLPEVNKLRLRPSGSGAQHYHATK